LKNADWEADFFFIEWGLELSGAFADTQSVSTWISQWWWNAFVSESPRMRQDNLTDFVLLPTPRGIGTS
jgi:hypothetical protein